jgi:CBS-domain-containing membrane protein
MRRIQRLMATFALTVAFVCSAVAGDMPTPGIQPPQASTAVTGDMPGPGVEATDSTSSIDPVTQLTLTLLQSLLTLF